MRATERLFTAIFLVVTVVWILHEVVCIRARWQGFLLAPNPLVEVRGYYHHEGTTTQPNASPTGHKRPAMSDLIPSRQEGTESSQVPIDDVSRVEEKLRDRVIVMGKLKHEDTGWVGNELPEWQNAIYTVNDPSAPLHVPKNKGKESAVYLQYIIDNYAALPSTIVFLHSHRSGWPAAWHTEFDKHDNVHTIKMLQTDFVQQNGYANLRCNPNPGCPDEIRPFREPRDESRTAELAFADAWREMFNGTAIADEVPDVVGVACCAQFAVSRTQVLKRPLSDYVGFRRWLMETELEDDVSGRVMEYMWHVIFGRESVYCPSLEQCYEDVYGM